MTRAMLAALCGLVLSVSPAATQEQPPSHPVDPPTAAAARRLLAVTGTTKLMLSSMESMLAAQKESNPQIPAAFWDAFMAHVRRDTTRLIDMLVPIYASHLTQSEIEELIRFYTSPIGSDSLRSSPPLCAKARRQGRIGES